MSQMKLSKCYELLLHHSDISTFYYAKIFDSGDCYITCSNHLWADYKLDHNFTIVAPTQIYSSNPLYHLVPRTGDELHCQIIHDAESIFSIYDPLDLIITTQDAIEVFSFAFNFNKPDAADYYLNNTIFLEKYAKFFSKAVHNGDLLPYMHHIKLEDNSRANIILEKCDISVFSNIVTKYLTPRERECMQLIQQGYSLKKHLNYYLFHIEQ